MTRRDLTADTAEDKFDVEAEARRRGIQPYQVRATHAVGDLLVKDLVADAYKGISASASMIPPSREPAKPKGNGWVDAAPLKGPDTRWCDRQMDAQDAQDKCDRMQRLRQQAESAYIEAHFDKGPRIESEYNPLDNSRLKE
jgi:hypothetical protein